MDKASSHTARSSQRYYSRKLDETGIHTIPFNRVPVKSPDNSPMDVCGIGLLKRGLASRRPTTMKGLWKVCQEVWAGIPVSVLQRSLLQWKLRCRTIFHAHGRHIEGSENDFHCDERYKFCLILSGATLRKGPYREWK
ncbi:hypothetical protein L9F63_024247 [Diploptera punctata]|uniref:Transposase n=1 Tax=Diploptera punctata TaxID=6984 RepID=A0AAD8E8G1_DIPPU|nr:hypothetical protein L9F63_024247 [Diploptera punctata]